MELLMGCLQHDKFVVLDTFFIPFYFIKKTRTDVVVIVWSIIFSIINYSTQTTSLRVRSVWRSIVLLLYTKNQNIIELLFFKIRTLYFFLKQTSYLNYYQSQFFQYHFAWQYPKHL